MTEALSAFRTSNASRIRRWGTRPGSYPEEYEYALYLLYLLGDDRAGTSFVEHYPTDREGLAGVGYIWAALTAKKCRDRECFEGGGVTMLGCAAIDGWAGAREKFIAMWPFIDAGRATDWMAMAFHVFLSAPDEILGLFSSKNYSRALVDSMSESGGAMPPRGTDVLNYLRDRYYCNEDVEKLRSAMVEGMARMKTGGWAPTCRDLRK